DLMLRAPWFLGRNPCNGTCGRVTSLCRAAADIPGAFARETSVHGPVELRARVEGTDMAATIDKDLVTALKAAKGGKPMQFAMLPKGTEGKLLVARKIPPKEIAEQKKAVGATSVIKGRLVGEDGTLVFEVAKAPPATLLAQLKHRIKQDAGLTGPVEIRV